MESRQDNLDLKRYLDILFNWWWVIVLVPVVVGLTTYVLTSRQTSLYKGSATVLIQQSQSSAPTLGDIQTSQQLASTYQRLITTRPIVEKVEDELGFSRGSLGGSVGASTLGGTQLLRVEGIHHDPTVAALIANTLATTFISETQATRLGDIARLQALAAAKGATGGEELLRAQLATLGSMTVVEPATPPGAAFQPQVRRNTILAAGIGLILALLIALLLEYLNNKVRAVEDVERLFNLSTIRPSAVGAVLQWRHRDVSQSGLVVKESPNSIYAEMFRQVRTGFHFVTATTHGKTFLITSVAAQEGKTTILANLGLTLAQGGSRVILVDSDLRRPSFQWLFGIAPSRDGQRQVGLCDVLADADERAAPHLIETDNPNLRVLTSGTIPPNPADLLNSPRMKEVIEELKGQCDLVLFDSPPVMAAADATILGSQVDGILLVVTLGDTRTETFQGMIEQIQRAGTPMLGYVLNKVKARGFGGYYGRYRYHYRYYSHYPSHDGVNVEGAKKRVRGKQVEGSGPKGLTRQIRRVLTRKRQ